ncbi:MAG TPA: hypothetical protein PLU91_17120 [Verrucomicrobiota bacterium]|nr:hypothetical protein [Verrucomicrobiota bacterium]
MDTTHSGRFTNTIDGTVNLLSDAAFSGNAANYGVFRKSAGTGTNLISDTFDNLNGTVRVDSGTLTLHGNGRRLNGNYIVSPGAVLELTGGTAHYMGTFSGSGGGTVRSSGGIQGDAAGLTIDFPGSMFQWTGSYLGQIGSVTNRGTITAAGSAVKTLENSPFWNAGTLAVTNSGGLLLDNGKLNNLTSGTVDIQGDPSITYKSGGTITNWGLLRKSAGTGTSAITVYGFYNLNGTVQVDTGTLQLAGGGTRNNGTYLVSPGAVLELTAGATYQGTFSASGGGTVRSSGGIYTDAGGLTLDFPGSMFQWTGSYLQGTGPVTNRGTITAAGSAVKTLSGPFWNAGTLAVTNSGGLLLDNGKLNNLTSGTVDIQGDPSITYKSGGTITNWGLLRKSAGTGTSAITVYGFYNLNGTVQVDTGTLQLAGGGTRNNGTYLVSPGAVLELTAGATYQGTFSASGGGTVRSSGGIYTDAGGLTLDFPGSMFQWTGSYLQGTGPVTNRGTITAAGSAVKTLSGPFWNAGTLAVTNTGALECNGATLNNLTSGTVDLQSDASITSSGMGGTIKNWGLFRKSAGTGTSAIGVYSFDNLNGTVQVDTGTLSLASSYAQGSGGIIIGLGGRGPGQAGKLSVAYTATLSGPVNVFLTNGFALATGDRFQILSCATRSGTFSTASLPAGTSLQYSNYGVYLVVTSALPVLIGNPGLSNGVATFPFNTIDGQSYTVERNDEVDTTNWVVHTNFTGNGGMMQFAVPVNEATQRFFRVRQP